MQVRVLFFGVLKDIVGKGSDALDLPEEALLADVLAHYEKQIPGLKESSPSLALAVNQQYATLKTKLKGGDEIALLPPVSGGAPETSKEPSFAAIVRQTIASLQIIEKVKGEEDGAVVVFEGVVRSQTRGRRTLYLDYEAYEEMALREMEAIAERSCTQFAIRDVAIVHRVGRIAIGETSVLIVVVSAHRAAAFDACRWLIDTLKRTVPIWKKEYFEDGAVWAHGEAFPEEIERLQGCGANPSSAGSPSHGGASK